MKNTQTLNTEMIKTLPKFWATLTGFLLILMALSAGIAYGYSFSTLFVLNDSGQTLSRLLAEPDKLTIGLAFWILIFLLDLLVSIGVYKLLKSSQKVIALWAMGSRLLYSAFLAAGIIKIANLWALLNKHPADVSAERAQAAFVDFNMFWSLGLIVFGIHLLLLGYGLFKVSMAPKSLCYLILFAGFSYILVHTIGQFGPQGLNLRHSLESVLALPMALGELLLAIWFIYIGLNKRLKA